MADEEDQTNTVKHDIKTEVKDEPARFTKTEFMMKKSRRRKANNYNVEIIINPAEQGKKQLVV